MVIQAKVRISNSCYETVSKRHTYESQEGTPINEEIWFTRKDTKKESLQDHYEEKSGTQDC